MTEQGTVNRTAPTKRCKRCFYSLEGLPTGLCPECAQPFDLANPATYTMRPPLIWWRLWLPGLLLSVGGGTLVALVMYALGSLGWGLTLGVPFAIGAILGYRVRAKTVALVFLAIPAVLGVIMMLMTMHVAGLFCGVVAAGIFAGPALIGVAAGVITRFRLKESRFSMRGYLPVLAFLAVPLVLGLADQRRSRPALATVSTSQVMEAPPGEVWDALMFYEEVNHSPPLLLRLGLPRPIGSSGSRQAVGNETICTYHKGELRKVVVELENEHRLGFIVTKQQIGVEHAIRLTEGSFRLETLDNGRTRITLSTEYEPLLTPRFAWYPFERLAAQTLHRHVLEGMRRQTQANRKLTVTRTVR